MFRISGIKDDLDFDFDVFSTHMEYPFRSIFLMHNDMVFMMYDVLMSRISLKPLQRNVNNHIINTNLVPLRRGLYYDERQRSFKTENVQM